MIKIKKIINFWLLLIILFHFIFSILINLNEKLKSLKFETQIIKKENLLKDFQNNLIDQYWNYGKWHSFNNIPKKYLYGSKSNSIIKPVAGSNEKLWTNFTKFKNDYGFYQNNDQRGELYWDIFKSKKLISLTPFENIQKNLHINVSLEIDGFWSKKNDQKYTLETWRKNFWIFFPLYKTNTRNLNIREIGKYTTNYYFYNFKVFFSLRKWRNDLLCSLILKYDQNENNQNYRLLSEKRKISVNVKVDVLQKFNYQQKNIYNFSLLKYGDVSKATKISFDNKVLFKTETKKIIDQSTFLKEARNQKVKINIKDLKNEEIDLTNDAYHFFNLKKINNFLYFRDQEQKINLSLEDIENFDFLIKIFYLWIQKVKWKWKYFWNKTRINKIEEAIKNTKIKHVYNKNIVFDLEKIKFDHQKYFQKITNFIQNIKQKVQKYDWLTLSQKINCFEPTIIRTLFFGTFFSYFYNYFGFDQNNCFEKTSLKNGKRKVLKNIVFLQKKISQIKTLFNNFNFESNNFINNEASLIKLLNRGALIVNTLENEDFKKQFVILTIFLTQTNNLKSQDLNNQNINTLLNSFFDAQSTNEAQILQIIGIKKLINIVMWQKKWYQKKIKPSIKKKDQKINNKKKDCEIEQINFDQQKFFAWWITNNQKITQKIFKRLYYKIIFDSQIELENIDHQFSFINDIFFINIEQIEQIKTKIDSLLKIIAHIIKIEEQKLIWNQLFFEQKKWWTINDHWQKYQYDLSIFSMIPDFQFIDFDKKTFVAGATLISGLLFSEQATLLPLILI